MLSPTGSKTVRASLSISNRKTLTNGFEIKNINDSNQIGSLESPKAVLFGKNSTKSLSPSRKIKNVFPASTKNSTEKFAKGNPIFTQTTSRLNKGSFAESSTQNSNEKVETKFGSGEKVFSVENSIHGKGKASYPKISTLDLGNGNENFVTEPEKIEITDVTMSPQYKSQIMAKKDKGSKLMDSYASLNSAKGHSMGHHYSNSVKDQSEIVSYSARPVFQGSTGQPWSSLTLPVDPGFVLKCYDHLLAPYERDEIKDYPDVFYIADMNKKLPSKTLTEYDDEKGDYLVVRGDHVKYRYEVIEMLGRGSFGQVVKVFDHKRKEHVALKVIRSQKKFHFQAKIEVKILKYMMNNHGDDYNITEVRDNFTFRNHVCIIFDLLSINLYDFLKKNKFKGFNLNIIRKFGIQVLYALKFLNHHKIIHCDLKPENILLKSANKTGIKLIDFGSSCFEHEKLYTYIQSRFYRSPEVILGLNYSTQIDMWSFGCLLCELYTGYPIFPGETEHDQILAMMEVLGVPERSFLQKSQRRKTFFDDDYRPKVVPNSKGKLRVPDSIKLSNVLKCNDEKFVDLVAKCLVYDPEKRFSPNQALAHEWILEGLPQHLQQQHLRLLEGKNDSVTPALKDNPDDTRQSTENLVTREKNDSKASLNRAGTKQGLGSASTINLGTVANPNPKPVRSNGSQQSLGDFSSIYQKAKSNLDGETGVVSIALTQVSNGNNQAAKKDNLKKQLDIHVKSKTLKEPLGDIGEPDDEFKKEISSPHASNFSMSSSRRRKFFPVGKTIQTEQTLQTQESVTTKAANSTMKSLSLEKGKIPTSTKSIHTPKDSIGKFIQDSKKETFFSTKRGILFPTIKSPTSQKKLI